MFGRGAQFDKQLQVLGNDVVPEHVDYREDEQIHGDLLDLRA
jgi:hypothetical protein